VRFLELRIPPPLLGGAAAFLMWLVAWGLPPLRLVFPGRVVLAVAVGSLGVLVSLAGVVEFRRARTTVNPMTPSASSFLVTTGIYTVTRNPMYLGITMLLLGWGIFLANPVSFLVLLCFIGYMNRFQIIPEERTLQSLFGSDFQAYRAKVRRWL
jgi:protein-S-isoprenylcysteine O-methyltransferase Ste14